MLLPFFPVCTILKVTAKAATGERYMAKNENLHKAKDAKKDEFYTQYEDIQNELNHYEQHFRGKTVFCNCDDPFESNFCKFFLRNFNYLGLKRLICTSYGTSPVVGQQLSLFDDENEPVARGHGYVMDIREVPMANGRGVSDEDIDALLKSKKRGVKKLKGDGDFRSEECIEYLKQADIVVTNPPFSLFREYVAQLVAYQKDFLIIGNVNAITYKEIFPLIKDNKLWLGASIHSGDRKFYVPDDYPLRAAGCGVDKDGRKYIRVKGVRWFTNLDYAIRHEKLVLYLYEQKTVSRNQLVREARQAMRELVQQMRNRICNHPEAERLMQELALQLETVKGKRSYGYLPKKQKALVDEIVDQMEQLPTVAECYEKWWQLQSQVEDFYSEKERHRPPLSRQKEFRQIKNAVIREAETIRLGEITFEDDTLDQDDEAEKDENVS